MTSWLRNHEEVGEKQTTVGGSNSTHSDVSEGLVQSGSEG